MLRGDLSNRLIHLTKGITWEKSLSNIHGIIKSGRLHGGNGHIRGGYNCICFSEAPISVLTQVLANPSVHGMRYSPLGVMVSKLWLYQQGGRPVIYQPEAEFELLHEQQRYRHVRYEPDRGIDHTWEREWRVRTDELLLDPRATTFVVPSRKFEMDFFVEHAWDHQKAILALGSSAVFAIDPFQWHFIVLEDLGVEVSWP